MDPLGSILRPTMQARARSVHQSRAVPRPAGAAQGRTAGEDPDRILLLGTGAAAGMGVRSHDLAIPGHLARELTARTGAPTTVDLVMDRSAVYETALSLLDRVTVSSYDAVVLIVGAVDAVQLRSVDSWRRVIAALLSAVDAATPATAEIIVVGIQPPSTVPIFDLRKGGLVDQQAEKFNEVTERLCSGRIHFLMPPALPEIGPSATNQDDEYEQSRVSAGYREWAFTIAVLLAELRSTNTDWR